MEQEGKASCLELEGQASLAPRHRTRKETYLLRWFRKKCFPSPPKLAQDLKNWCMFSKYMLIYLKPSRKLGLPWLLRREGIFLQCGRPSFDPWVGKIPWRRELATQFSIIAWTISWTERPGGLQSMGLQRAWHDWMTNTFTFQEISDENSPEKPHFQKTAWDIPFHSKSFSFNCHWITSKL